MGKACKWDFSGKDGELRELLVRLARRFPEDMAREAAEYFLPGDNREEEVQKGADLLDLHDGELNGESTLFTGEDWTFMKDLVNDYAAELDMEWVTYFMQFLLDRDIL